MPEVGLAADLPTTFGKYYLTEKLATGGMAEIYLAKLIGPGGFEKSLVIKQILPKLSGQRHFVDLFVAEAKILVTLAHGNIVPVYELGVVDDTYFIAMDYIDGPTLYRLTETMARRDEFMEPVIAAWITARILDGLDYAHRKGDGVIHRDLSPRNVMVSRDGEVKLVDFGIAVALGESGQDDPNQAAPTGSFPYMSPEQVRRDSLTPQTDLFSVGVLFWEMLVGRRLFARREADATLEAVLRGEIPVPSSQRMEIPAKLDELVMRALERDQAARWPNASEMLAAINRYLYTQTVTPTARDVAALVARHCPPETRRFPTNMEPDENAPAVPAALAGPQTAVIPRDPDAQPRGKRHVRHQTFATHVELQGLLERVDPADPADAAEPTTTVAAPTERATPADSEPTDGDAPVPDTPVIPRTSSRRVRRVTTERPDAVAPEPPVARPPSRALLVVSGLGAIALSIAAVAVFYARRDAVMREDARVPRDAAAMVVPIAIDAAPAPEATDAGLLSSPDAAIAVAVDAGHREPRDASVAIAARPDAVPADATVATATATIDVGANPWGEVYIDGVKMKATAPHQFRVAAGHHDVRVVFPAETPAPEKTFSVEVSADETKSVQADFR